MKDVNQKQLKIIGNLFYDFTKKTPLEMTDQHLVKLFEMALSSDDFDLLDAKTRTDIYITIEDLRNLFKKCNQKQYTCLTNGNASK